MPDDQRLSGQGGVLADLHGRVERVHVQMGDDPLRSASTHPNRLAEPGPCITV